MDIEHALEIADESRDGGYDSISAIALHFLAAEVRSLLPDRASAMELAIKAIEESQPPETTPWDCVDAIRRKFAKANAEGDAGATCDTYRTATDAWRDIKKRIDDNERWMSQAHIMCSDLGISQGHIEDRLFDAIDRLHDLIRLKENLPDLLEYVEHDSWRCGYYDKCHCGLNDLTDKLGLERVPLPVKGENT